MPNTREVSDDGVKLSAKNFNTILMYVVTLGVGIVCMQAFSTANKVSLIEGKQVSRTEVESKLDKLSTKQDRLTELINDVRLDIAKLSAQKGDGNSTTKPNN
jgi:hypothetical protein